MYTFGVILIIYGMLCLLLILMKPPILYNNIKVKTMIKMMGKKGFDIFFIVWTIIVLGGGILIVTLIEK
ncbi:MAG: hypothetical protein J7K80_02185 [Candidatus Izimaplasma sp.]|nr:hypothetical protein [Candidatus Izimaplasma bacterium]